MHVLSHNAQRIGALSIPELLHFQELIKHSKCEMQKQHIADMYTSTLFDIRILVCFVSLHPRGHSQGSEHIVHVQSISKLVCDSHRYAGIQCAVDVVEYPAPTGT